MSDGGIHPAKPFPEAAHLTLQDGQMRRNLGHATRTIRAKREKTVLELPDWEELREAGSSLKAHVMANLEPLLLQLEQSVTRAGGVVHWARDAEEARAIVTRLVQGTGAKDVVKVKSITVFD